MLKPKKVGGLSNGVRKGTMFNVHLTPVIHVHLTPVIQKRQLAHLGNSCRFGRRIQCALELRGQGDKLN